jgi:16S rRNA (guanine527-N7)-methyltransferase
MEFMATLKEVTTAFGMPLSVEQVRQFSRYYELLMVWNEKMNLTAITDPREVAVKHIVDSLSCLDTETFPYGCSVVDVGAGAGFPGVPLKIYRPDIRLYLVDSLLKRVAFLHAVVIELRLDGVAISHLRAEDAGRKPLFRNQCTVAVSRAVARLNVLCELCLPLVAVGGHFVALKGARFQDELSEAQTAIDILGGRVSQVKSVVLPGLDDVRAIIYIEKRQVTPQNYPRKAGIPEKKPL